MRTLIFRGLNGIGIGGWGNVSACWGIRIMFGVDCGYRCVVMFSEVYIGCLKYELIRCSEDVRMIELVF